MVDTQNGHSFIGASGHHRWNRDACPGSVREIKKLPPEAFRSSAYAEEGTDAHAYAALCAAEDRYPRDADAGREFTHDDRTFTPDAEMVEHITGYLQRSQHKHKLWPGEVNGWETHFDLGWLHPGAWGTSDRWRFIPEPGGGLLIVRDLKYGGGKWVDAFENGQLMYYALGVLEEVMKLGHKPHRIRLQIDQPRMPDADGNPERTWEIDLATLLAFKHDLKMDMLATEDPDAPLRPDPTPMGYCHFCPARVSCPALKEVKERMALESYLPIEKSKALALPNGDERAAFIKRVTWVLQHADLMKSLIESANEVAYELALAGVPIPGRKLVKKKAGARKYTQSDAETIELLRSMGVKDAQMFTEPELRSPAQLEKQFASKKAGSEIVALVAEATSSGYALAPESDPRPAVDIRPADAIFTSLGEQPALPAPAPAVTVAKAEDLLDVPDFLRRQ